jgi:hypothetical protein
MKIEVLATLKSESGANTFVKGEEGIIKGVMLSKNRTIITIMNSQRNCIDISPFMFKNFIKIIE